MIIAAVSPSRPPRRECGGSCRQRPCWSPTSIRFQPKAFCGFHRCAAIEAGMGLGSDREPLLDLHIQRDLVGVVKVAERPEWGPFAAMAFRGRAKVSVQRKLAARDAHAKLVLVGVEELDPVPRAFGEGQTMPCLLHRTIPSRLALTAPAGNFELRPPRVETRCVGTVFH